MLDIKVDVLVSFDCRGESGQIAQPLSVPTVMANVIGGNRDVIRLITQNILDLFKSQGVLSVRMFINPRCVHLRVYRCRWKHVHRQI